MDGIYPVIEEISLAPVQRRRLRSTWRDPATLPEPVPGSVYVFEYGGRYREPYSRRVHGSEPHVVAATAVALVQTREWPVEVRRSLPSRRPGTNLVVRAVFRCNVTDPGVVATAGPIDCEALLATHIAGDRELATLGRHVIPERAADAVLRIEAQMRAYCTVNPPEITGVTAALGSVEVHAEPIRPVQREAAGIAALLPEIGEQPEEIATATVTAPLGALVTSELRPNLRDQVERLYGRRFARRDEDSGAR